MTPTQFIATLPEPSRAIVRALHATIRTAAPKLEPFVRDNRIRYGHWAYRYPSGRHGDAAVVAVAPLKTAVSLYVQARRGATQKYPTKTGERLLPQIYAPRLGKVTVGKSNVRIRTLDGVSLDAIADMVREAAAIHGRI